MDLETPKQGGNYFCFFQHKHKWVGLKDRHPELYERAEHEEQARYRHIAMKGRNYAWSQGESLPELIERREEIEAKHQAALERAAKRIRPNRPLLEVLSCPPPTRRRIGPQPPPVTGGAAP
ncbi:hypothetical protein ABT168_02690 [Streptomyces sp. NPDC001793]|uniref:hypothetical protein n=1 Tax=Streptomyces sp. NPDC001793 TaxID=3154657 RepID=UPI0033275A3C